MEDGMYYRKLNKGKNWRGIIEFGSRDRKPV